MDLRLDSMKGLGDNIYQRAVLREYNGDVYLDTPWPELYQDLPNIKPIMPDTKLRTQAKNVKRSEFKWFNCSLPVNGRISYNTTGMLSCMESTAGVKAKIFDLPDFGPPPVDGKYIVVRPATVRSEWRADSRNPLPEYIAEAAKIARECGYKVVSIADLEDGKEWLVGDPVPADIKYHNGELSLTELMALISNAVAVIGGVGFLAPSAMAYNVPAWIICGGWGAYNSPENLRIPMTHKTEFCLPDNFCKCNDKYHNCDKRITEHGRKFTEFLKRHALMEC